MTKFIEPGSRVMDRAYLRDGAETYTGEALLLACLLHAKGKTRRGQEELEEISKIMKDPNARKNHK